MKIRLLQKIFISVVIMHLFISNHASLYGQPVLTSTGETSNYLRGNDHDVYGTSKRFIENIGQYGTDFEKHHDMGNIAFAYEGFDVPVLFTPKGLIYLHRKIKGPTPEEREREEYKNKKKKKEEEIEELEIIDRSIAMEWVNSNSNVEIIKLDVAEEYHSYGTLQGKARAYKKIIYKNLLPGIDVIYTFLNTPVAGFEYSLDIKPGADLGPVKMRFKGDVRKIKQDYKGNLVIKSDAGATFHTLPVTCYGNISFHENSIAQKIKTEYSITNNEVSFSFPENYDTTQNIIIDPFVTATGNLTGTGVNAGIAKDVDFDYAGNVYVTGGGDGSIYKLAKFNASGVLQWTFSGSMTIPAWTFGTYYGGWVVDKNSGNVYLGQGFAPGAGHRVIRLNTTGIYDNYVTTANPSFLENWKMYWSCNNGSPQILIAGGGTNSNINFGICSPPSTIISSLNVTGIPYSGGSGWAQDISDLIIDPASNALYTIYGSLYGTPSLSNKIYKNNSPYSGASVAWNVPSGFTVIQEIANRPYLVGPQIDNSSNVFAINSFYLFYWDGKNLKAFNKATGTGAGIPLTIAANVKLMSGGIIADECNNIYVGSTNGTIKVYSFNGTTFDDAAQPDILIPGFGTSAVFDLAYYESQKILYASGKGFVSSFDLTSYNCVPNLFTLNINSSCGNLTATASLSPPPPLNAIVTYVLYNGATQLASNTTGIFTGLTPNINYTVKATVNQVCSGTVTINTFTLPGPAITPSVTNTTCGTANGVITINAAGGMTPYTYSNNGVTFQPTNSFTGLASGLYTITVNDANGCSNTTVVNVINSNGPTATFTKTDAICGTNSGTITANGSGGIAPLTYSINSVTFQTGTFFTGIAVGTYTLTVKDATGCTNVTSVTINSTSGPTITAVPATTFCNTTNGSITAFATGGVAPLQYSLNANIYQGSNIFTNLAAGTYTITVKDANGCLSSVNTTVPNSAAPTVTAIATTASCANANGSITASSTGGTLPKTYSINGTTFQTSNFFVGLMPGVYIVTVKDANNCTNTVSVNVNSTSGPQVTGTAVASSCVGSTGSITASGSGGAGLLQYSINGINFQSGTLFSGLAANTYTLMVRDVNGCLGAATIIVPNSSAPAVTVVVTPTACTLSNGIITANGTGGTPPYQFSINGITFQAGNIFSGLATGPYTVTIKDQNACTSAASVTVTNVAGLSVSASNISSSCTSNNGSITAIGNGGTAPLQFSINGVNYQSGNTFNSLAGGNYTVYVKDATGCISTTSVTINTMGAPQITASSTDASCGGNNGTIAANGSGGTPPLQFSINGTTYQSNGNFINLAPGIYTVYVRDTALCIQTTSVTITNFGIGQIPNVTYQFKNAHCGNNEGKIIDILGSGGTPPYMFSLNGGPFVSLIPPNNEFLNLTPGTHTLTIMDANGCIKTVTGIIGDDPPPTVNATSSPTPCGASTGTIVASGSGLNPPFQYSIDGGLNWQSSGTFSGLSAGTYTITIWDDEDCLNTVTVTVFNTGGPTVTATKTDGTCGLNNGVIVATGNGGSGSLSYSINGTFFQSSGTFSGLAPGVYTITVEDGTGCTGGTTITILNSGGPSITALTTPTSCGNANGIITATGTGGAAPLQYSINGTVFQSSGVFTGLVSGTYTVTVLDAALCFKTTSVTVTNRTKPTLTAYTIPASCNSSNGTITAIGVSGNPPYQFSINGTTFQSSNSFIGLNAGFYAVTIRDADGCTNTTGVSVGNLAAPQVTLTTTPSTCFNANGTITANGTGGIAPLQYSINGITFQPGNVFTGLLAGPYTVIVKDANGCQSSKNILVTNPNVPQTLAATITNTSCGNSNGSIVAAATGGVAPLQYSINGTVFQSSTTFSLLAAGTYTLTVKDVNGCTKTITVSLLNLAGPTVNATPTLSSCFANDGTITAMGSGGTGILTYSKNGVLFQSSNIFTGLAPGSYTITVKDSRGCISTTNVIVGQVAGPTISAYDSSSACGGIVVASGTGGALPYQYNINNGAFQSNSIFTCLLSGIYTVSIIDANGCRDTITLMMGNPLPVALLSFDGHNEKNHNVLEWITTSEVNSDYFTLEKSPDGLNFESIAVITGAGNSTITQVYTSIDENPFKGLNYYRLKQTDYNGMYQYSNIIVIHVAAPEPLWNFVYNSSNNELIVYCNENNNDQKTIQLIDAAGRIVYETVSNSNYHKIYTAGYGKGYYSLRLLTALGSSNLKVIIY